jgi:hypothetical protein
MKTNGAVVKKSNHRKQKKQKQTAAKTNTLKRNQPKQKSKNP